MMMDLYGNVPIDTTYGDFTPHPNVPRAQVFNFIEREVKAAMPNLSRTTGMLTYGRATKLYWLCPAGQNVPECRILHRYASATTMLLLPATV